MSKYICPNCNHDFKQKSNYITHIENKKKPCVQIAPKIPIIAQNVSKNAQNPNNNILIKKKDHNCTYCNKQFSKLFNLNRHLTTCKQKKEYELKQEENKKETDEIQYKLFNKIAELEQKINILETKKTSKKTQNIIINNNNNGVINNTNNNITNIANFGKLDNKKIGDKIFYHSLTNFAGIKTLLKFIEYVHKNEKLKEYQNVEITDLGRNLGRICTDNEWRMEDANEITDKIIDEGYSYYELKFDELEEEIEDKPQKEKLRIKRNKRFIFIMKGNEMFNMNDEGDYVDDDGVKITPDDFKNGRKFEEKLKKQVKMLLKK